jgi:hypothetical protein
MQPDACESAHRAFRLARQIEKAMVLFTDKDVGIKARIARDGSTHAFKSFLTLVARQKRNADENGKPISPFWLIMAC